jgi:hypothetical protein
MNYKTDTKKFFIMQYELKTGRKKKFFKKIKKRLDKWIKA